ncbi:MAG: ABC transporter ATP-binding protein [bacterium]|nr:ABC transporter ATP-binding protein [bacterium]
MNAIEIHNLNKTYTTGTKALDDMTFTVNAGDFFGLLGANGAGKTTLIGILTGLVRTTSGTASIFDHDIITDPVHAKMSIGVVPQEFNFNIFEKVIDVLVTQAGYFGVPRKKALAKAERLLRDLDIWEKHNVPSRTLSGGMKRRLMIARALMHEPALLILDEPTAGVDIEMRRSMWKYLRELNNTGTTILLTTHNLEEAEQLCKNLAIIKQGRIIQQGSVSSLLSALEKRVYIISTAKGDEEITISKGGDLYALLQTYHARNIVVSDIRPKENRLEQLYMSLQ